MHLHASIAIAAAAALAFHLPAQAGGYVEGPDLSNNRLAPTAVPIDPGSNVVRGTSGFSGPVLDRDFFKITVAAGTWLTSLVLGPATVVGGGASFIGMQAGDTLTVNPDTVTNGSQLLGWHLYGSADVGQDILGLMGSGPDKIGFSGPLPAGTYTFWVQELSPPIPDEPYPPYPYEFDLRVQAVPEPSAAALLLAGAAGLAWRTRRREHRRP